MGLFGTKSPVASLTIQASAVTLALSVLSIFGISINPTAVPDLQNIVTGIAAGVAIFGRVRAKELISH